MPPPYESSAATLPPQMGESVKRRLVGLGEESRKTAYPIFPASGA